MFYDHGVMMSKGSRFITGSSAAMRCKNEFQITSIVAEFKQECNKWKSNFVERGRCKYKQIKNRYKG